MVMYGVVSSETAESADTRNNDDTQSLLDAESSRLENGRAESAAYGAISSHDADHGDDQEDHSDEEDEDDKEIKELQQKRVLQEGGWLGYLKGFAIFLPYILPYKDRFTQFWILIMISCVVVQRFLTVMIPRQFGNITEALGNVEGTGTLRF